MCGKSADVNLEMSSKYSQKLLELFSLYSASDIFYADETGLFKKLLPNKTLTFKNVMCMVNAVNRGVL